MLELQLVNIRNVLRDFLTSLGNKMQREDCLFCVIHWQHFFLVLYRQLSSCQRMNKCADNIKWCFVLVQNMLCSHVSSYFLQIPAVATCNCFEAMVALHS